MINYILQVILFQVLFLAIYDFFFSKETFFTKNRWYLMATPLLSFLIPFIKIPTFQKAIPQELIIQLPEIVLSPEKVIQETEIYQSVSYISILFWIGVIAFSILFLVKLFRIANLVRKYEVLKKDKFTLVFIPKQTKAFSFFNYIFLGNEISISQQKLIIEHELVHSKQKHSLDLLFFEFLKIMMWFNPMIYFYQKRITLVHEYISDAIAAKSETKETYINNLLSNFFQVENIAFVNQFYKQTLIKKRIIMMKKNQSKKMNQLKYLLLVPVIVSMLFYTSCASKQVKKELSNLEKKLKEERVIKDSQIKELTQINQKLGDSIVKLNEDRKFHLKTVNFLKKKIYNVSSKEYVETEEVSFMAIDKAPTFPGCDSGDKACFSKGVQKHFIKNFDSDLPNKLGLESGKKRVFIGFKIDKEGNIVNVNARAPHPKIKAEVIRVMNTLPQMIPGENNGKKVVVKYSIPFTIFIAKDTK
ncbi:M56 family metallopeptidase [Polaribacter sp. Z022]|uniref:M56 family metallopeptidase n=1 Tax=Polaribacter sp. Z022 TaxID=2927125 RepID=UPI0020212891|nr:M56 family metallopeptidase [Polaribacter sp. Z022]MCL7753640.1 M56 family metallopeptidase [Polaribacter sp. Z022]